MAQSFNINDPDDQLFLKQWLQTYTQLEWQEFVDFSFSDAHKRSFTYDERNCLKVVKDLYNKRNITESQLKWVSWAYNLVSRIVDIKETVNTVSASNTSFKDGFEQPSRHFTLRVAWHDNMWNGSVCKNPDKNIYCNGYHSLLSDRIRRQKEKVLPVEMKYAGELVEKMISETGELPPCYWSINLFGKGKIDIKHINPADRKKVLDPIDEVVPAHSIFSWPFGFSFVRSREEYKANGRYPANLEKVRVSRFRSKIKETESIGFVYAKFSNPLSYEDMKYLVVGCGIIKEKGDNTYFKPEDEIEKIRNSKADLRHFPSVNWALRFSFKSETMVRMPYHEYLEETQRRNLPVDETEKILNKIRVTIDEPELEHCFKYVAMDIDDDEAIFILTKIRNKLLDAINDGIVEVNWINDQINRVEDLLEHCWNRRAHFPGFKNLSRILLNKNENEKSRLDQFVSHLKGNEPDYSEKIADLLNDPGSDRSYSYYFNDLQQLKNSIEQIGITVSQFLTLAMLNLSSRQFEKINDGIISKSAFDIQSISENPYLLYEEYEPDKDMQDSQTGEFTDGPIELFKIDIAYFPNTDYLGSNLLQNEIKITDKRRIRALIIHYLRSLEFSTGDCFDDAKTLEEHLQEYPLFYKTENAKLLLPRFFLENSSPEFDAHLSLKLHIHYANDTKYYYLKEIYKAENEVGDFIQTLLDLKEPNILKYEKLDKYLGRSVEKLSKKIGQTFDKESFLSERNWLYENLFLKKFFVICGNPGSGKSYETLNIVRYFIEKGKTYLLLTPTGKAALRLKFDEDFKDIGIEAMTIDKFITQWKKKPGFRKEYNNIIIDEMSMVTITKLHELFNCFDADVPSLHRVILVGDPHQLPPIGFGKPFFDIIQRLKSDPELKQHIVELDVNCRQELEGNAILDFSKLYSNEGELSDEILEKIKSGGKVSEGFRIRYWANEEKLLDVLRDEWQLIAKEQNCTGNELEKLNKLFRLQTNVGEPDQITYDLERFQIITPYRIFSDKVNLFYQHEVRHTEDIDILKLFKNQDKIIRTQNYYNDDELILSNGSIGIAMNWKSDKILCFPELEKGYMSIYGEDGIRENEKEFFELAYSITIHKSQGSGFEHLVVVLPKRYGLLSKELFYTGLTRSKKTISVLIEGEPGQDFENSLFEYARRRSYTETRKTSLMLRNPHRYYGLEPENGIFVQSRVEQIIYRHLMKYRDEGNNELDFRYEKFPEIDGKEIRIKTDFTIYTKRGIYFWEHLGMLTKRSYEKKWLELKKPTYKSLNVMDRLITTHELNGISDDKIEEIIKKIMSGDIETEDRTNLYSDHHYSLR